MTAQGDSVPGVPGAAVRRKMSSFRRDALVYWFGEVGVRGIQFLLLPVLGRILTPVAYGAYSVLGSLVIGAAAVGTLGMEAAAGRFIPGAEAAVKERLSAIAVLTAGTGTLITGTFVYAWMLGNAGFAAIAASSGWLFPLATSCAAMGFVALSVLRALRQSARHTAVVVLRILALVAGMAVAWLAGLRGVDLAIRPVLWSWVLFGLLTVGMVLRPRMPSRSDVALMLNYGPALAPHMAAHYVMAISDRIVLQAQGAGAQVGQYSFAYQLSTVVLLVAVALNNAWAPRFNAMPEGEDDRRNRAYSSKAITVVGVVMLVVAGWGPMGIRILSNSGYWEGGVIMPTLALAFVFNAVYLLSVNALLKGPRSRIVSRITVACALVNVAFNVLMVPRWGMWAPAVSTLLTYLAMSAGTLLAQRDTVESFLDMRAVAIVVGGCVLAALTLQLLPVEAQVAVTPVLVVLLVAALLHFRVLLWADLRLILHGRLSS